MIEKKRDIIFKIFRFNSEIDYFPYYLKYKASISKDYTVLDALEHIRTSKDSSISYSQNCCEGACGVCSMRVNNKHVLACQTYVFDLLDEFKSSELLIEPQSQKRSVKDLILNRDDFFQKYSAISSFVDRRAESKIKNKKMLKDANACLQCGICFYACPVVELNEEFLGPALFLQAHRFKQNKKTYNSIMKIINEDGIGIWNCLDCFSCSVNCPKELDPARKILALKNESIKKDISAENANSLQHIKDQKDNLEKHISKSFLPPK